MEDVHHHSDQQVVRPTGGVWRRGSRSSSRWEVRLCSGFSSCFWHGWHPQTTRQGNILIFNLEYKYGFQDFTISCNKCKVNAFDRLLTKCKISIEIINRIGNEKGFIRKERIGRKKTFVTSKTSEPF
jgi:hypothetical protein